MSFVSNAKLEDVMKVVVNKISDICFSQKTPGISKINEISSQIYLSEFKAYKNTDAIHDLQIGAVIGIGTPPFNNDFKLKAVYYIDIPNNRDMFFMTYDIVNKLLQSNTKILIVCEDGVSLGPSVLLYILTKRFYELKFRSQNDKSIEKKLIDMNHFYCVGITEFIKGARGCIDIPLANHIVATEYQLKLQYQEILLKRLPRQDGDELYSTDKRLLLYFGDVIDKDKDESEVKESIGHNINDIGLLFKSRRQ